MVYRQGKLRRNGSEDLPKQVKTMGHLRLIHSAGNGEGTVRSTVDGVQVALFPDPRTIVLVRMDEETGARFPDILRQVRPRLVADVRALPRFDFGGLSRSRMFHAFNELMITYHDLGAELDRRCEWPHRRVVEAVRTILTTTTEGPLILLLEGRLGAEQAISWLTQDVVVTRHDRWQILVH
jgi:hypothetical protein